MDPFTAIGLAGNIVQFVDFTGKLISGTLTWYHGNNSEHVEMETLTEDIRCLAEKTRSPDTSAEGMDKTLRTFSDQCIEVSDGLLRMLRSLKVDGKNKAWESFYKTLKQEWKRKDIRVPRERLDRIRNHLTTHLMKRQHSEIIERLDLLSANNKRLEIDRTQEIIQLQRAVEKVVPRSGEYGHREYDDKGLVATQCSGRKGKRVCN
jgi:hypothetical protein